MLSNCHRVGLCTFAVLLAISLILLIAGCGNSSSSSFSGGTTAGLGSGTVPTSGGTGSGPTTGGSAGTGTTSGGTGSGSGSGSGSGTGSGGSSGSGTTTGGGGSAQNPSTCDGMAPGVAAPASLDNQPLESTFLYVGESLYSNTPCGITGFLVSDDGRLELTPGSPYAAPGLTLVAHPTQPILYGSDLSELASYFIASDGRLHKLANYAKQTDHYDSFAQIVLTADPLGKAIYAVEGHPALNQTIESLNANQDGTLTHLQDFEVGPAVRSLSFIPDGSLSLVTECSHLGPFVYPLKRSPDGMLSWDKDFHELPEKVYPPKSCPIAAATSPDGKYFAMAGIISQTYTPIDNVLEIVSSTPNDLLLMELEGSPYSIGLIGISDVTWHPNSEFIAVGAQKGVSMYRFEAGSTPTLIDGSPFGGDPIDRLRFNKAGTLLFATSSKSQKLYVFKFKDGKLSAAPGSPYALPVVPYELAVVN
jgi:hypothetical protein